MQRILVVLPFYGGSLPIGRYCVEALKDNGCLVEVFEAPEFFSAFSALKHLNIAQERLDFLENSFLQVVSQAILANVERFSPDLVLCLAQAPMSRQALQRLRSMQVPTAMWFVEDYRLFPYWRAFAPLYDIFAVIQKEPFLSELEAIGCPNALYLPLAALPSLHAPMELSPAEQREYKADVSFLGAGYPNRREAFTRLTRYNFKIWGTEWDGAKTLEPLVQRNGARISPEEAQKIYNATAINLNLHSSIHTDELVSKGDFVNPRTFELAACGAFQLVDRRELMPELFDEDELALFSTLDEMDGMIRHYLDHPEERKAITGKARERVLREHTYQHRMAALLEFVQEKFPAFGQRQQIEWPREMPEHMQKEVEALLNESHLPPTASFSDVVAFLRGKGGQMNDTEAALLFLDEWQKLYTK